MFEDALKDSWAYQEILQEGKLEERQEGLQRQRQALEYLIRKNFPNIQEMAKERGNAIDSPDVLQDMILQLFNAETEEEVRRILEQ